MHHFTEHIHPTWSGARGAAVRLPVFIISFPGYSQQYRRLLQELIQLSSSTLQLANANEQQAALLRHITKWQHIQTFYMLHISSQRLELFLEDGNTTQPERTQLYLPSASHELILVPWELTDIEKCLHIAQANDTLAEICQLLQVQSGLLHYKKSNVGNSQWVGTRARSLIMRFSNKITHCINRYRAARGAVVGLDPGGKWSTQQQCTSWLSQPTEHHNLESQNCCWVISLILIMMESGLMMLKFGIWTILLWLDQDDVFCKDAALSDGSSEADNV